MQLVKSTSRYTIFKRDRTWGGQEIRSKGGVAIDARDKTLLISIGYTCTDVLNLRLSYQQATYTIQIPTFIGE